MVFLAVIRGLMRDLCILYVSFVLIVESLVWIIHRFCATPIERLSRFSLRELAS